FEIIVIFQYIYVFILHILYNLILSFKLKQIFILFIASYIHVCGRKNPNYGECIVDSINSARSKVCTGMPEYDIPPLEPVTIDKIVIYNTDNLKLSVEDSKIRGFCDFEIKSINISPDQLQFDVDFMLKHLEMDSTYDFDIRLLVSLANRGLVKVFADNLEGKLVIDFKIETKNDRTEIYASKVNVNLDVKTFKFEFDDSEKDMVQLHEILSQTINDNQQDIINKVKPIFEKKFSEVVMTVANKIAYNRKEQLFPDKP
ncbi:PREDICTED: uncharacterized protein LOC105460268, partial [Wasmannia auropunctata]|uniref:uncharacterized protein LOC105460268 n=1 Tax=Wasmannia auropunctata TaxID=64793 RepID=UPI0005EF14ED